MITCKCNIKIKIFFTVITLLLYTRFTMSPKRMITRKKSPYKRTYVLSTCFLCQKCFSCQEQLLNKKCSCELTERPPFKKKNNARNYYTRIYNLHTVNRIYTPLQISEINDANKTFSYNLDFSSKFNYSLCVKCHNLMARLKKKSVMPDKKEKELKEVPKNEIIIEDSTADEEEATIQTDFEEKSSENTKHGEREFSEEVYGAESSEKDEDSEEDNIVSDVSFKLVINQKGKNSPAKWLVIQKSILRNFLKDLNAHVQQQLDQWVEYDDYIVTYKQANDKSLGTQLSDEKDWEKFLLEYQNSISRKKEMMVIATIKSKENESDKTHPKKRYIL